jgi:hypothetical protein
LYFSGVTFGAEPVQSGSSNSQGASRSAEARLRVCLNRQDQLLKRSEQLADNAANSQEKFDAIAGRVKDFYTSRVIPSGKTVANYNSLVGNIDVKKTAVQAAVTKARGDLTLFSCAGADPKGQMMSFKDDMMAVRQKLQDYRGSVKDLIVAVHSVTGREKSASNSASKSAKPLKGQNQGGDE